MGHVTGSAQDLRAQDTAAVVTTLVLTVSFLTFLAAYMNSMNHYGAIAAVGAASAFVADIVVAPALLALSPGRYSR